MNMKKILAFALCLVLVAGLSVAGTLAYLQAQTGTITNTFTTAGLKIELNETYNTDTNGDNKNDAWTAQLVPAAVYKKDPVVSVIRTKNDVKGTDVDIYLYVKMENNASQYISFKNNLEENGWAQIGTTGVYWREVTATEKSAEGTDPYWNLIGDDTVTINSGLTEADTAKAADVTLKYTAYAVQTEGFENAEDAWSKTYGKTNN